MTAIKGFEYKTHPSAIENLRALLNRARRAIMRPPPRMNVPDWADKYRYLSASVGAVGGRWQTHRVEVARAPMMAVTEPGVGTISVQSCTQLLKTELLTNTFGYFAHLDPAPILLLEPKDSMANAFSKERIAPMIASTPVLRELMGDKSSRTSDDTQEFKRFPGGFLAMLGAGSPSNLAMRAIRVTLLDEIDKYEVTKEGDPVNLAEERTSTFAHSALHVRACSPTWEETSRIGRSIAESDMRRPYVACPHCGHEQFLDFFRHVHWEKVKAGEEVLEHLPDTAHIHCEACGAEWSEVERVRLMTTKHAIRAYQTRPFHHCGERQDPKTERLWDWDEEHQVGYACCKHCGERAVDNSHAGFFGISKLYSPFITVVELVKKWLESKDDPDTKQTFYNTQLGELYKAEVSKSVNSHYLATRAEDYGVPILDFEKYTAGVPENVVVLTAGLDVQAGGSGNLGRIEVETVGWGIGEESWSVHYEVFNGDPAMPEVWAEVDKYLLKPYRHALGFDMRILAACIDSGGHNTNEVYAFARPRIGRNVWPIKGASDRSGQWSPTWPPAANDKKGKKYRVGFKPILLGVNSGKESIRQKLLVENPGPGYCHFPVGRSDGWYEQLTSEDLEIERKAGVTIRKWTKKKHVANEALDCRVYAYAALLGLIHTRRFNIAKAAELIRNAMPAPEPTDEEADSPAGSIAETAIKFRDVLTAIAEGKTLDEAVAPHKPKPKPPPPRPRFTRSPYMS